MVRDTMEEKSSLYDEFSFLEEDADYIDKNGVQKNRITGRQDDKNAWKYVCMFRLYAYNNGYG